MMKHSLVLIAVCIIGAAIADTIQIKTNKDAQVTRSSYGGCGVPCPDAKQGTATTINIGSYHLSSSGLFGYFLAPLNKDCSITKAELVFPKDAFISSAGSGQAILQISKLDGSNWTEDSVTYNTKPSTVGPQLGTIVIGDQLNVNLIPGPLDVTGAVITSLNQGEQEFGVEASTSNGNSVFLNSREKGEEHATFLNIQFECQQVTASPVEN
ncbi:panB [Acrasis kona]|uniref:PanB n=1 Tax=Acrasis kona TaxID=1008807 RepID=A0AAW2ZKS1_9EUKA